MKRIIKFRGLRTDGQGWVYGSYFYDRHIDVSYIIDDFDNIEIITETVGQFTGLIDNKGMDIYEGDVLISYLWEGAKNIVTYKQEDRYIGYWFPKINNNDIEVIGNIHE